MVYMSVCCPQDDYESVVKMIACPSWPAAFSPLRNVFELINKVKAWIAEHEQLQTPVIIVDKYVFCSSGFCLFPALLVFDISYKQTIAPVSLEEVESPGCELSQSDVTRHRSQWPAITNALGVVLVRLGWSMKNSLVVLLVQLSVLNVLDLIP